MPEDKKLFNFSLGSLKETSAVQLASSIVKSLQKVLNRKGKLESEKASFSNVRTETTSKKAAIKDSKQRLRTTPAPLTKGTPKNSDKTEQGSSGGRVASPDLYRAGPYQLTLNGAALPPFDYLEIEESIDMPFRTGKVIFTDSFGLVEKMNLLTTKEKDILEIELHHQYEESLGRKFRFGIYSIATSYVDPSRLNTTFKRNEFTIMEEPFYTNYYKKTIGDSFLEQAPMEMVGAILDKYIVKNGETLYAVDENSTIMPSFIVPHWSPIKTIMYLNKRAKNGPGKVFNVSIDGTPITVVTTLQKIFAGKVYPNKGPNIIPTLTNYSSGHLPLGADYKIWGPSEFDRKTFLNGESLMKFSYLGGSDPQPLPDFVEDSEANYTFSNKFAANKRDYASIIGGEYEKGINKVPQLGDLSVHDKEELTEKEHRYMMDVDPKKIVEHKMLNRFFESYHNQLTMSVTMPGFSVLIPGQIYHITFPSVEEKPDESITGDWILYKVKHIIKPNNNAFITFESKCVFIRTGFELDVKV